MGLYRQYGFDLMRAALIPKTSVTPITPWSGSPREIRSLEDVLL
jgi:hypothetical protein